MKTSAGPVWIHNPIWPLGGEPGLPAGPLHGTLTRHALDCGGSLSLEECFAMAAPHFMAAIEGWLSAAPAQNRITVIGAHQVHGDHVERFRDRRDLERLRVPFDPGPEVPLEVFEAPETDAYVTTLPGVVLVIKTADCVPILLWDPETKTIGAAHCGWRGIMAGLASKTVREMVELGAREASIQAWLGPGIRERHYEVSSDLADRFREAFPGAGLAPGRYLDLFRVATHQLTEAGLDPSHIADSGQCTFANPDRYHSYRREGELAGRILTVIALPPVA
jgi:hypothetical protein